MTHTEPDVGQYLMFVQAVLNEPVPDQSPAGREADLRDAVRHAEELIATFGDHDVSEARFYAAWAWNDLFHLTGDPTHLDREIEHLRAMPPTADATELLVDALSARQEARGDNLDDIEEALRLQRTLVAGGTDPEARMTLGLLVAQRFRTSPPDDPDRMDRLAEAMALLTDAEHTVPPDDPDRPRLAAALGHLHVMRHLISDTRAPGDLDHGIDLLRGVAEYYADGADRLAVALDIRHSEHERPADRDEAIAVLERLCAAVPDYLDDCAADLGMLYMAKLEEEPTQETFERTVDCLEHALRQRVPDAEYLHVFLIEAYLLRWGRVPADELERLRALCAELAGTEPFWSDMLLSIDVEQAVAAGDSERIHACAMRTADVLFGPYREDKDAGCFAGLLAALLASLHGAGLPWPDWSPFTLWAKGSVEHATALLGWLRDHRRAVPAGGQDHALFVAGIALLTAHLAVPLEEAIAELDGALDAVPADHPAVAALGYERGRRSAPPGVADPHAHTERSLALLSDSAARFPADDLARARCLGSLGIGLFSAYIQGFARRDEIEHAEELISGALGETGHAPEFRARLLMSFGLARGLRWLVDPAAGDMREGFALHEQALAILPDDHPLCLDVRYSVSLLLIARSHFTRNLDDAATAEAHLRAISTRLEDGAGTEFATAAEVTSMLRLARLARITHGDTVTEEETAELDEIVDELAANPNPDAADDGVLAFAQFFQAHRRGDPHGAMRVMSRLGDTATAYPEGMPLVDTVRSIGTFADAGKAALTGDRQAFEDHVAGLAARAGTLDVPEERARLLFMAGGMWSVAHTRWREPHLLDRAIALFEDCREHAGATAEPYGLYAAEQLSTLYWQRRDPGDAELALDRGFTALREHARQVLLHEEVAHGASKAGTMADTAHALAHRCVAAGRLELAVAAVENGRGLAMHAATSDVGAVLRELGHDAVALEWERQREDRPEIPNDLRHRVLALLAGTEEERRLLSAPSPVDIAGALREVGADALVYLVPAAGDEAGRALFVASDGRLGEVPLPMLTLVEVDRYLDAYRLATVRGGDAVERWRAELGELVRWAWPAVVGPVLAALGGEVPHVVLVPCGALGVVPWHAACDDSTGRSRFAVELATFSCVASARQLCDVATRPRREPAEAPVVVADPTGDLYGSTREARYLYQHCYPGGEYHGVLPDGVPRDGVGSPEDVLAVLPYASLLHLACHAVTGAKPAESYVELTDRLTVTRVLRSRLSGGLVVLAACASDLTDREHDEALTLATAFLAAGAGSVVGTRWAVDDQRAAVLMCLFHRYLTVDGMSPAQALRAAQLWALDRDRELPADIAAVVGSTRPEIPLTAWAAFSHQGR